MYARIKCSMRETVGLISVAIVQRHITYSFVISFSNKHGERKEENEVEEEKEIYRREDEEKEREIVKDPSEVGMRVHEIRFRFRGH